MSIAQIRKYPLALPFSIQSLPLGKILKVSFQHGKPNIWVAVDLETADTLLCQQICTVHTGGVVDVELWEYVDSAVSDDFVWHVYKRKEN